MATASNVKENRLYRNWIRGALGLKYLKENLEDLVDRLIKQNHQNILRSIAAKTGLQPINCKMCTLENLSPAHSFKRCISGRRSQCFCYDLSNRRRCPNDFCSSFYDMVVLHHEERIPCWSNTNPRSWCSDHWAFAQCFMQPGNSNAKTAQDTDVSGLLSVIINNITVRSNVENVNVYIEARHVRNSIIHSPSCEMNTDELQHALDVILNIVKRQESSADVELISRLEQLKKDTLDIGTDDISEALALKDLEDKKLKAMAELSALGSDLSSQLERKQAEMVEKMDMKFAENMSRFQVVADRRTQQQSDEDTNRNDRSTSSVIPNSAQTVNTTRNGVENTVTGFRSSVQNQTAGGQQQNVIQNFNNCKFTFNMRVAPSAASRGRRGTRSGRICR